MTHLFDLMFEGFWHFFGGMIILSMMGTFLLVLWNRFWRHWSIRKHGYPPGTDADGDFPTTEKR